MKNIQVRRAQIIEGENLAVYKHGLKIGVVVSYTGDAATGKGIAMHVAAFNPVAISAEGVSAELIAKRKKLLKLKQSNLVSLQTSLRKWSLVQLRNT